jgi:two-component system sensor histidine kinase DesK
MICPHEMSHRPNGIAHGGAASMTRRSSRLDALRSRLLPPHLSDLGWAPVWSLLYLGFLFMTWNEPSLVSWLIPTLISIAMFLPLYFRAYWLRGYEQLCYVGGIAGIGFALAPFNGCAHTYLIYAAVFLPFSGLKLRTMMSVIFVGLAFYAVELSILATPAKAITIVIGVTAIVSVAVSAANYFHREKQLRQAELKLSHDEVRRLAALAERERIGRDLHDLLGHTLSLITLKSELAARLFDRDPLAARREIVDVERVARDALGQVRRAVTGIRAAGLSAELASAHLLLESGGVQLDYESTDEAIPPEIETVLALTIREAVTNIQRHANASHARVRVAVIEGEARVAVEDNGRGGTIAPGNGLTGMRERLRALGGDLVVVSERGRGTKLEARLILRAGGDTEPQLQSLGSTSS